MTGLPAVAAAPAPAITPKAARGRTVVLAKSGVLADGAKKKLQEDALLLITEHALVVAARGGTKVLKEMQLADVRAIESTMRQVRPLCTRHHSSALRARDPGTLG